MRLRLQNHPICKSAKHLEIGIESKNTLALNHHWYDALQYYSPTKLTIDKILRFGYHGSFDDSRKDKLDPDNKFVQFLKQKNLKHVTHLQFYISYILIGYREEGFDHPLRAWVVEYGGMFLFRIWLSRRRVHVFRATFYSGFRTKKIFFDQLEADEKKYFSSKIRNKSNFNS